MPVVRSALVPPGNVCCWPTEATSAELDVPRGTLSTELDGCGADGGGGRDLIVRECIQRLSVCECVCVFVLMPPCLPVRGPRPNGHEEQSRASQQSLTALKRQPGRKKKGMCEPVSIISLPFKVKVKDIGSIDHVKWCR